MKEKLVISTQSFGNSEKIGNLFFTGNNISNDPDYVCFYDGYIVDDGFNDTDILSVYKQEGIKGLNRFSGKYNVIIYSKKDNLLEWTNDFLAGMTLYYYHNKEGLFVLSNHFWSIVDIINPSEKDVDFETIAQYAVYGMLLNKESYIKGLKVVDIASNYIYNCSTDELCFSKYDDFSSFTEEEMSLDEATDEFQRTIIQAAEYIKNKHKNDKVGAGLSGGLDSRIVPALFGDSIDYFVITGPNRVKRWLKPYNFRCIDDLAKAYGISVKKICQEDTPFETKMFYELKNGPLRAENILKIVSKEQVGFDVLFTSGEPNLLASDRTMYESGMSLFDIMEKYQGHRYIKTDKKKSIKGLLKFIFVDRNNTYEFNNSMTEFKDFYPIKSIPKEEFYQHAHNKIEVFTALKSNPKEAILREAFELSATESTYGAFESFSCQMKTSYTYLYPWAATVLKHVPSSYIDKRALLKNLIHKYYPKVETIASEHSIDGIYDEKKTSSWKIIKSVVFKLLGGGSVCTVFTEKQKVEALKLFDATSSWYDNLFDGKAVRETLNIQPDIFRTHLKIKMLLKVLEDKDWKKFIDE